jgi:hypothetical protein
LSNSTKCITTKAASYFIKIFSRCNMEEMAGDWKKLHTAELHHILLRKSNKGE